jgi:hypothetical protein
VFGARVQGAVMPVMTAEAREVVVRRVVRVEKRMVVVVFRFRILVGGSVRRWLLVCVRY